MTEREIIREGGQIDGAGERSAYLITEQLKWAIKEALGKDEREYSIAILLGAVRLKRRMGYNP